MRTYSLSLLLLTSFLTPTHLVAAPLTCPSGDPTAAELSAWRAEASNGLAGGSLSNSTVASRLQSCFGPEVPACFERLESYVQRNDIAPVTADPGVAATPEKQPPRELLAPGGRGTTYTIPEDIEAIAAAKEWPAVRYKSRHAGGFDTETPSLLMVYVPGDRVEPPVPYDRWLNFALPRDQGAEALIPEPQAPVPSPEDYAAERRGGPELPRTFTMVSLKKASAAGPGEIFFQKFYRSQRGSPLFTPEATSDLKTCIGCHPNGLRAIAPLGYHVKPGEAQMSEEARQSVALINQMMLEAAAYKTVSWREVSVGGAPKKLLKPEAVGPSVGPLQPLNGLSRSREFILGGRLADGSEAPGCYRSRSTVDVRDIFGRAPGANNVYRLSASPSIRWEKVRDAMKCSICHNNQGRGAINAMTRWDQVDFKILVDRSMPFGAHGDPLEEGSASSRDSLTLDERIALANCLKEEFTREQRELAKWLNQMTCR